LPILGAVYSFAVIIVGQFFLLNLILAIMIEAFKKSHQKQLQEALLQLEANETEEEVYLSSEEEEDADGYTD
jgi:hypothetical protein